MTTIHVYRRRGGELYVITDFNNGKPIGYNLPAEDDITPVRVHPEVVDRCVAILDASHLSDLLTSAEPEEALRRAKGRA